MTAEDTRRLFAALEGAGATVRFVGGCVRDAVIGRPATDIDLATDARPKRVIDILTENDIKVVPTGIEHGTVTAIPSHRPFQLTTLRRDVDTDGRRATVQFSDSWAEDASRRDFTINALSATLDGAVYDYTGGIDDLTSGRVRFIGQAADRVAEDYLRILRFFRFHAGYAKTEPDAEALAACAAAAAEISTLSGERVWQELSRILAVETPGAVFRLMETGEVLEHLFPAPWVIDRVQALAALESMIRRPADPVRRLAALIEVNRKQAAEIAARLRLSRAETRKLDALVTGRRETQPDMEERTVKRALYDMGPEAFVELVLLDWADAIVREPAGATGNARDWKDVLDLALNWTPAELPVSGADATALGVREGPEIGELLEQLQDWWIDRDFQPDREACLDRLRLLVRRR